MFDIDPDDIRKLDDVQLRELVARLVKAECQHHGFSSLHVTWSGSQTAADGGLDVRVELPAGSPSSGAMMPRPQVGYQVKKPDMRPAAITDEMRPNGVLRPVIAELAALGGAYIIVSSTANLADTRLQERRTAMRDALHDCADAAQLHTEFVDRRRLADWANEHAGVVLWIRAATGRAFDGWRPFGNWSNPVAAADEPYLIDEHLRIHVGTYNDPLLTAEAALARLREMLRQPRQAVRLVGLSGVGKTRFLQAMFDARVGTNALAEGLAIYTDLGANPSPQPVSLASDLIAQRRRAILIVDNCGTALHQELAKTIAQSDSEISLVTVEYDVREDLSENTHVVTIGNASSSVIQQLIVRRHPEISPVNVNTIAAVAGGNARIALAIAGTVKVSETHTHLASQDLFGRLFWQRHPEDRSLLRAAQAVSLVYSFDGETDDGADAELPKLAELVNQTFDDIYPLVAELGRRELVQRRANWHAVLPQALANYLASRALDDITPRKLQAQIVDSGNWRLIRSFARRLSYLHTHRVAISICEKWLAPGGLLADFMQPDHIGNDVFHYAASVVPERVLSVLEQRARDASPGALAILRRHALLLRAIAFDANLFERSTTLLIKIVASLDDVQQSREVCDVMASFFQFSQSGTHSTPEVRFALLKTSIRSPSLLVRQTAVAMLQQALSTAVPSKYGFTFGSRQRDHGLNMTSHEAVMSWFMRSLSVVEDLLDQGDVCVGIARSQLTRCLPSLWRFTELQPDLDRIMRKSAAAGFWLEGWLACREALARIRMHDPQLSLERLEDLYAYLAPADLASEALALMLRPAIRSYDKPVGERYEDYEQRKLAACEELGAKAAAHMEVLDSLAPDLLQVGMRVERFGRGLAARGNRVAIWPRLVDAWKKVPPERRNPAMLRGFLSALREANSHLASKYMEECHKNDELVVALPALYSALGWNETAIQLMEPLLDAGRVPISEWRYLANAAQCAPQIQVAAADLLTKVAAHPGGFAIAVNTFMHWSAMADAGTSVAIDLLRRYYVAVLSHAVFEQGADSLDYEIAQVANVALAGDDGASLATNLTRALCDAARDKLSLRGAYNDLLETLMRHHPLVVLDALYLDSTEEGIDAAVDLFSDPFVTPHPIALMATFELITWCSHEDPGRIAFAIEIVPVLEETNTAGRRQLTRHARALLEHSASPTVTLAAIIDRLWPSTWSGSRAAIVEANATALDEVLPLFDTSFQEFARHAKAELLRKVETERDRETESRRVRDERFE